jgi:hypothetical protein
MSLRDYHKAVQRRGGLRQQTGALHILRHTFCSHLAMRGAAVKAIQELAGHTELTTTMRYMHLSPAAREDAIRLLDRRGRDARFWRHCGEGRGDGLIPRGIERPQRESNPGPGVGEGRGIRRRGGISRGSRESG